MDKEKFKNTIYFSVLLILLGCTSLLVWHSSEMFKHGIKTLYPIAMFLSAFALYYIIILLNTHFTINTLSLPSTLPLISSVSFISLLIGWQSIGNWWLVLNGLWILLLLIIIIYILYKHPQPKIYFLTIFIFSILVATWMDFRQIEHSYIVWALNSGINFILISVFLYVIYELVKKRSICSNHCLLSFSFLPCIVLLKFDYFGKLLLFFFVITVFVYSCYNKSQNKFKINTHILTIFSAVNLTSSYIIIIMSGIYKTFSISIQSSVFLISILFIYLLFILLLNIISKKNNLSSEFSLLFTALLLILLAFVIIQYKPDYKSESPNTPVTSFSGIELLKNPIILNKNNPENTIASDYSIYTDKLSIISNMSFSESISEGQKAAKIDIFYENGKADIIYLKAGINTAEWCIERDDIKDTIQHSPASIYKNWTVTPPFQPSFTAHSYIAEYVIKPPQNIQEIKIQFLPDTDKTELKIYEIKIK